MLVKIEICLTGFGVTAVIPVDILPSAQLPVSFCLSMSGEDEAESGVVAAYEIMDKAVRSLNENIMWSIYLK